VNGRSYRETDVERSDLESVISDLCPGNAATRFAWSPFNIAERWSEDVSEYIAREIVRLGLAGNELPSPLEGFVEISAPTVSSRCCSPDQAAINAGFDFRR
jgi:hypothetical protein